ncbi:hypothetical protein [Lewinella sp. LCG006]|uniref:hypothetical protein n=1 Tax=Lewinella sp. LCG006 TaxID=3231911 RepID=UPI00346124B8
MRILLCIVGGVIIYILSGVYNHNFTKGMITGNYINSNFEHSAMEPQTYDELAIFNDGTFDSVYFGHGVYELSNSFMATKIKLKATNGSLNFSTYITRQWFGKPKIIFSADANHYYKKK